MEDAIERRHRRRLFRVDEITIGIALAVSLASGWLAMRVGSHSRAAVSDPTVEIEAALLTVDSATIDFGKVTEEASLTHTFQVQNTTLQDVFLRRVATSCTCTAADFQPGILKPGEIKSIPIRLNVGARRGEVRSIAQLEYSSTGAQRNVARGLLFMLKAISEPLIRLTPETVYFRRGRTSTVDVDVASQKRFDVIRINPMQPAFTSTVIQDADRKKTIRIRLDGARLPDDAKQLDIRVELAGQGVASYLDVPVRIIDP